MSKAARTATQDNAPAPLTPRTEKQAEYLQALRTRAQVFALGPAGTGKTWMAATMAADLLSAKKIGRIILSRPIVPGGSGRSRGASPGDKNEKMANWVAPVANRLKERLGAAAYDAALRRNAIGVAPFETMRGLSRDDSFIILDEAQNATAEDMKMFLTRVGECSRVVVNGGISQCALRRRASGLAVALYLIDRYGVDAAAAEFGIDDIVRSGTCAEWVRAFHLAEQESAEEDERELFTEILEEWAPDEFAS